MVTEVRLPPLGDTSTLAKLATWLKAEGDRVVRGEPIVELETDKTTVEVEAPENGMLQAIHVAAGTEGLAVDTLLATIVDQLGAPQPDQKPPRRSVPPASSAPPDPVPINQGEHERSGDAASPGVGAANDRVPATALARKMAAIAGVDLAAIRPAAGHGRITKADVENAMGRRPGSKTASDTPVPSPVADPASRDAPRLVKGHFEDQAISPMRRVTATRLQQSKQTVPHFYLQAECRVDRLIDARTRMNDAQPEGRLTFTDLLVFVASRALREVPLANSAWMETVVRVYHSVDIAVAVNTPKGLVTPVVRDCHVKSLSAISQELKELVARAREGDLRPDEYTGATFTLSNLGMFSVTGITPIVNPPHACILGVGAIESRPVVESDGTIVPGHTMVCTLSADHRAVDGAIGAALLTAIRRLLEEPMSLALYA